VGYTYARIARPRAEIACLDPHRNGFVFEFRICCYLLDNFLRLRNFGGVDKFGKANPHWSSACRRLRRKDLVSPSISEESCHHISSDIRQIQFAVSMSTEQATTQPQLKPRYSMSSIVALGVGVAAAAFLVRRRLIFRVGAELC
jgi:hypothetical protein